MGSRPKLIMQTISWRELVDDDVGSQVRRVDYAPNLPNFQQSI